MSSDAENQRRKFLKSMLLGTGTVLSAPRDLFLSNIILNYVQNSHALAAGDDMSFADKKFIHVSLYGGIPRWYWDLPLTPNGNDELIANPMVITKYNTSNGLITGGTYATTKIGNFHMPHMWSGQMATVGGSAPMSELAKNMLIMRGIDLQIDNHEIDRFKQTMPVPGSSLLGMVADQATTPVPAISHHAAYGYFASKKGIASIDATNSPLTKYLSAFTPKGNLITSKESSIANSIDRALAAMAAQAGAKHKFLPTTFLERMNAKKLLSRQFGDLEQAYITLYAKYAELIRRGYNDRSLALEGVDDGAFAPDMNPRFGGDMKRIAGSNGLVTYKGLLFYNGTNMNDMFNDRTCPDMLASAMAVSEFMITQGLSSSVNVLVGDIGGLNINSAVDINGNAANGENRLFADCHDQGAHTNLIIQTKYFRSVASCLNELIGQLKAVKTPSGNLFDNTAVALTSDFNRSARMDGSGSDHGFIGSNYTIFNGQIPSLTVVGNTTYEQVGETKLGHWGQAGHVEELGGREAMIGNVASTFSTILDLKTPTPNDKSFVFKKDGKIVTTFKPKNVKRAA